MKPIEVGIIEKGRYCQSETEPGLRQDRPGVNRRDDTSGFKTFSSWTRNLHGSSFYQNLINDEESYF